MANKKSDLLELLVNPKNKELKKGPKKPRARPKIEVGSVVKIDIDKFEQNPMFSKMRPDFRNFVRDSKNKTFTVEKIDKLNRINLKEDTHWPNKFNFDKDYLILVDT